MEFSYVAGFGWCQSNPRDLERQEGDPGIELTQNGETGYRIQR
jgi:hypothetical protein